MKCGILEIKRFESNIARKENVVNYTWNGSYRSTVHRVGQRQTRQAGGGGRRHGEHDSPELRRVGTWNHYHRLSHCKKQGTSGNELRLDSEK
jgi:hypothetical protein